MNKLVTILMAAAMAATPICFGMNMGGMTITPTAGLLLLVCIATIVNRTQKERSILPLVVLKEPAFIATLIYFSIGIISGVFAADKILYIREIVQRTTIIWIPFYCTALGFRTADQAKTMFLWYIPAGLLLSILSAGAGISGGLSQPVYLLGLHKNMSGGLCATMSIICLAYAAVSKRSEIALLGRKLPMRIVAIGSALVGVLGIVAAQSRGAMVEVLIGAFIILVAIRAKPRTLIIILVTTVVCGALVLRFLPERAVEHMISTKQHSANMTRVMLWSEMVDHVKHDPFLIVGWGNPLIDAKGYYYYDMACVLLFDYMQMGMAGALALLAMMFFSVKLGLDNAKRLYPHSLEGFVNVCAVAIVAGKFAHGLLDTFWIGRGHTLQIWPCVGICVFTKLLLDQRQQRGPAVTQSRKSPAVLPSR